MIAHPTQNPVVFAASLIGSWQWDIANDRVNCDRTNAQILGLTEDEAAHGVPLQRVFDAVHPEDRAHFRDTTAPARVNGGSVSLVIRTVPRPSVIRRVLLRGHYAPDAGFGRGVLIDITGQGELGEGQGAPAPLAPIEALANAAALCGAAREGVEGEDAFRLHTLLDMALIELQALMDRRREAAKIPRPDTRRAPSATSRRPRRARSR